MDFAQMTTIHEPVLAPLGVLVQYAGQLAQNKPACELCIRTGSHTIGERDQNLVTEFILDREQILGLSNLPLYKQRVLLLNRFSTVHAIRNAK